MAELFTMTSVYSLAGVVGILVVAQLGADRFLPKMSTKIDRFTWIWLAFDALIHL